LEKEFGAHDKKFDYLGMLLNFQESEKVKIFLQPYIKDKIESNLAKVEGVAATPAAKHFFVVREDVIKLCLKKRETFIQ